jgi:hypothetical protein
VHERFCPRPEAIWASGGLNTEVSVTARLNTILVSIYRGLAIFELNTIITVDDATSCELQRLSFEEFRGSTGEHIRSLSPMWSLSWNEGFTPSVRDREQERDKQQSATAATPHSAARSPHDQRP